MTLSADYDVRQFGYLAENPFYWHLHALRLLPEVFTGGVYDRADRLLTDKLPLFKFDAIVMRQVNIGGEERPLPFPIILLGQRLHDMSKDRRLTISRTPLKDGQFILNIFTSPGGGRSIKVGEPNARFSHIRYGIVSEHFFPVPHYNRLQAQGGWQLGFAAAALPNGHVIRGDAEIARVMYAGVLADSIGTKTGEMQNYHSFLVVRLKVLR